MGYSAERWLLTLAMAAGLVGCAGARVRPEAQRVADEGAGEEVAAPAERDRKEARAASPYLGAEPIELAPAMAVGTPQPQQPPAADSPPPTAPSASTSSVGASSGALSGAGFVFRLWLTACIVGGPFTLAVCIVGFPYYWPYLVAAVAGGTLIGATIGAIAARPASAKGQVAQDRPALAMGGDLPPQRPRRGRRRTARRWHDRLSHPARGNPALTM